MAHTKGPWSICGAKDCKCGTVNCADHPIAQVTSGEWGDEYPAMRRVGGSLENHYEAYIERIGYGEVPKDEAKANARLISAAPDLLEFVQQIFNGIDTGMITIDTPADETLANILSRGRKALSKATGAS